VIQQQCAKCASCSKCNFSAPSNSAQFNCNLLVRQLSKKCVLTCTSRQFCYIFVTCIRPTRTAACTFACLQAERLVDCIHPTLIPACTFVRLQAEGFVHCMNCIHPTFIPACTFVCLQAETLVHCMDCIRLTPIPVCTFVCLQAERLVHCMDRSASVYGDLGLALFKLSKAEEVEGQHLAHFSGTVCLCVFNGNRCVFNGNICQ